VIIEFNRTMELFLRALATKTEKSIPVIITEALAMYDAVLEMAGQPAVIKDGMAFPIEIAHRPDDDCTDATKH
jgi:predicted transcriptional regulator